ncbi:MAG: cellulase family glycosylhydrolase, partial [Anaerolineales bacterium]
MNRKPSNSNLSLFIGVWLGLTVVAGLGMFAILYWATNSGSNATPVAPASVTTSEPTAIAVSPTTAPTANPQPQPAGPACNWLPYPASDFGYGIQVHALVPGTDNAPWMTMVRDKLGLQWVKLQVRWQTMEPQPGQIDWGILDNAMDAACANGLRPMLSVVAAPDWTRANPRPGGEAPPDDYAVYAAFVGQIIDRYGGKIQAIEVWNEANLDREWNTDRGVSAAEFAKLQQVTHDVIRAKNPDITIIAGAPSPTGVNCNGEWPSCAGGRPGVVDDAAYLRQFITAGGLNYADCLGVHSNGTNLPPTADAYNPPPRNNARFAGPWASPHYSWSLKSQVETYAKIMQEAGVSKPMCLTEFGYAAAIDGVYPPNFDFAADISEQQQAQYLVEAYN